VTGVSVSSSNSTQIVFSQDSLTRPANFFAFDFDSASADAVKPLQITQANSKFIEYVELSEPEEFTCKGANGDDVHTWFLKPVGFDPTKKYPSVMIIVRY